MASPFAFFRKYQRIGMAFLAIGAMFLFTFDIVINNWSRGGRAAGGGSSPTVVTTSKGRLSRDELQRVGMEQSYANRFLIEATQRGLPKESRGEELRGLQGYLFDYSGLTTTGERDSDEALLMAWILRDKAAELGVVVSDERVRGYIQEATSGLISPTIHKEVLRELGVSVHDMNEFIRNGIASRIATEVLFPRSLRTPTEYWDYYRRLNEKQKMELVSLAVEEFTAIAPQPTDTQLKEFFEKHKNEFEQVKEGVLTAGFRQPDRGRIQYLRAKFEDAEKLVAEKNPVSDEDIVKYYEENKERQYQIKEIPADPKADAPKTEESKPEQEPSGEKKPAEEKPATDKPADQKPAEKEKPAAEKPEAEKPAEPKPADKPQDKPAEEKKPEPPEAGKPEAGKSDEKPAAEKPAEPKPAEDKPSAEKPTEGQPEADKPAEKKPQASRNRPVVRLVSFNADEPAPAKEGEQPAEKEAGTEKPEQPKEPAAKPEEKPAPEAKPAAEENPAEDKPKPAAEEKPAAEKPTQEQPAEKPETAKPDAGDKPAEAQPAAEKPAPDKPATDPAKPAEEGGVDAPAPVEPKFKPLDDELKTEIREKLISQRASALLRERIGRATDEVQKIALKLGSKYPSVSIPADQQAALNKEFSAAVQPVAKAEGLEFGETRLMSVVEFSELPGLGKAREAGADENPLATPDPITFTLFGAEQTRLVIRGTDPDTSDLYVVWKIEHVTEHVPTFDEEGVKDQVVKAWKRDQALPLTKARAEALAKKVRDLDKPMAEALAETTVTGGKEGVQVVVNATPEFTWLRQSSAPSFMMATRPPEISTLPFVEKPGDAFMKKVFTELKPGEVGVAANIDSSVWYVVKVTERTFNETEAREAFFSTPLFSEFPQFGLFSPFDQLASEEQRRDARTFLDRLQKQYQIAWNEAEKRKK